MAREVIATQIADNLLNHVGPGLAYQLEDRLGVTTPAVAAAYTVVRELFGVEDIWSEARAAAESHPRRWEVLHDVQLLIEHAAVRLLRHHGSRLEIGATVERYRSHLAVLASHQHGDAESWRRLRREVFELSETAKRLDVDINRVAFTYLALDEQLDLSLIGRGLAAHRASTWWDAMSAASGFDRQFGRRLLANLEATSTRPGGVDCEFESHYVRRSQQGVGGALVEGQAAAWPLFPG